MVLVSGGMLEPKKRPHPFARLHRYLNYGLLGLATILEQNEYEPTLVHGNFDSPERIADLVLQMPWNVDRVPLMLSLPSTYAVPWAARFCSHVKEDCREARILVGGRWVIDGNIPWVAERIPHADLFVSGLAEERILELADIGNWREEKCGSDGALRKSSRAIPWLNYRLSTNYGEFHPSIEVSRGCGKGCSFCAEKDIPLWSLRDPRDVGKAITHAIDCYQHADLNIYFESSFFTPNPLWAQVLLDVYKALGLNIKWRAETRVDCLDIHVLELLAKAGLKILDLGLESASAKQIVAMRKHRNPNYYLERASRLLRVCNDLGIWAKVNVLWYAGETYSTAFETIDWLNEHRRYVKGVSVGPVVIYGATGKTSDYVAELLNLGATLFSPNDLDEKGYCHLNLSGELDHVEVEKLSLETSQSFMSQRDYFDLKAFSYFPRGYLYETFLEVLRCADRATLPFSMDEKF